MSEPVVVICNETERPDGIPNCRKTDCSQCGGELWIGAETLRTLTGKVFEPVCIACAPSLIEPGAELMPISEHQLGEMPGLRAERFVNLSPS